jgi:hypothetical protein
MKDTSAAMERKFHEMLLARSPQERLVMTCRMFGTAKALIRAGLLHEYGCLDPGELRRRVFLRLNGDDFGEKERERIASHIAAWPVKDKNSPGPVDPAAASETE